MVCLGNDHEIGPTVFDVGRIECSLFRGDALILNGLGEDFSHPFTGLDSSEFVD